MWCDSGTLSSSFIRKASISSDRVTSKTSARWYYYHRWNLLLLLIYPRSLFKTNKQKTNHDCSEPNLSNIEDATKLHDWATTPLDKRKRPCDADCWVTWHGSDLKTFSVLILRNMNILQYQRRKKLRRAGLLYSASYFFHCFSQDSSCYFKLLFTLLYRWLNSTTQCRRFSDQLWWGLFTGGQRVASLWVSYIASTSTFCGARTAPRRSHLLCECPSTLCTSDTAGALLKRRASSFSSLRPFIRLSKLVVIAARQQQSRRPAVQSGCGVTWPAGGESDLCGLTWTPNHCSHPLIPTLPFITLKVA